jgi:hypothetical protein
VPSARQVLSTAFSVATGAATVLVDRQFFRYRMYGSVELIGGPRHTCAASLFPAWELCTLRHLHYCAVCGVEEPCPGGAEFATYALAE